MDPFALAFYAVICAALSMLAPSLPRPLHRLGLGAAVGVAAAATLPSIKVALGI
ncbi:hypothetical protein O2N63_01240 [Aliiroseovarius sp. KMU-50]|uniref:Uncharacterized protein n=1 Tax=Aliiroseovarius salicola TaxID=3009082 RepID=A0ABT4VWS5_9RHOB|nr:hypothetical protein [Aliiroseovarius sp. KMU-50]MDA5092708.1 hypothetical protein [Aliiroseovarius sp. KMU-50]